MVGLKRFINDRSTWFWIIVWVVLVLVASVVFSTMFWDWLSVGESNGTTIRKSGSEIIRNLGLVIAAIVALPLAIWRSIVAEHQATASQRQAETAQRGLLNERYQKGAEMLGSVMLPVRLGGIYALARLAREHPEEYHTQIMQLFCAFVRIPPDGEEKSTTTDGDQQVTGLREDVQAILTAIGKRSEAQMTMEREEPDIMDFSCANLDGANLNDADLSRTNLCDVKLSCAMLFGANLSGAVLSGADLYHVDLPGADLSGAVLFDADLSGAILNNTTLTGTDLSGCKGLTQNQLDQAIAHTNAPPNLNNVVDAETGEPLVWRGNPIT